MVLRRSKRKPEDDREIEDLEVVEVKKRRGGKPRSTEGRGRKKAVAKEEEEGAEQNEEELDPLMETVERNEEEAEEEERKEVEEKASPKKRQGVAARAAVQNQNGEEDEEDVRFCGEPVPEEEARARWPHRYDKKASLDQNGEDAVLRATRHYMQAEVDGCIYNLNDDAYVKAGDNEPDYIGRIVEFFQSLDHQMYFTAQWFFRPEDTAIKEHSHSHDARRVFLSDEKNDNALSCIVRKIRIVRITPKFGMAVNEKEVLGFDLYYDMSFSVAYSTFENLLPEVVKEGAEMSSTITSLTSSEEIDQNSQLSLLDLYSGCGAMSTGLCLGANLSGVNLQTRWAVDINNFACESLKFNHPNAEVRNENAEDFLAVLREWVALCKRYGPGVDIIDDEDDDDEEEPEDVSKLPPGVFEVEKIIGICYGKTENVKKDGLKFKVCWKGYGPEEDTWEPVENLSDCQPKIKKFVRQGFKNNILPLPGSVDVVCGGPPCQGISGFNRFRDPEEPFKDEKNKQMLVFMDIIDFLKPKFVLMENVVDILKFAKGLIGRYALSRLVSMKYQARLGILAAGNYGLPQYRMRVFLWGAQPTEKLPPFPLPTHDVVVRGGPPVEFQTHFVAYHDSDKQKLEQALLLYDAISDLPPVANNESRDVMPYGDIPKTAFQSYIRLPREAMLDPSSTGDEHNQNLKLFDHRPLRLNEDDYQRVCEIPKRKGANFRDLPGVCVGANNIVEWDKSVPRVLLPSGKPLVPDYAMSFIKGKSLKPFGRLWWDETVPTVVTRAEPHNQIIIHPEQDRVLTIRENARLQGFPDYYRLFGPIKARYIQVGNAVAVPVSRALGFGLGRAYRRNEDNEPVFSLPQNFPINL